MTLLEAYMQHPELLAAKLISVVTTNDGYFYIDLDRNRYSDYESARKAILNQLRKEYEGDFSNDIFGIQ